MRLVYISAPVDAFNAHPYRRQDEVHANVSKIRDTCVLIHTHRKSWLPVTLAPLQCEYLFNDMLIPNNCELLARCDAVLVLPGWETSAQCAAEIRQARKLNRPIYNNVSELPE